LPAGEYNVAVMEKVGRNDPCPCGKKKPDGTAMKYKKCCESKEAEISAIKKKEEQKEKDAKWRRKFFSGGPYTICPKCGLNTFGRPIMTMRSGKYTKECYECGHSQTFPLPDLKKKIIYLDQFVIDNFVKALDPTHPKHQRVIENPFWLEAYKKLDILSKAQLIVCPDSFFHRDESAPTGYFGSMQRIYEHLSDGSTFYNEYKIQELQIRGHFRNFLRGNPTELPSVDSSEIVIGELNKWRDSIRVSVSSRPREEEVEEKLKNKEKSYADFLPIFERWKTEKDHTFEDWFREEIKGFVTGTIQVIARQVKRRAELPQKVLAGEKIDLNDVFPLPSEELITSLIRVAHEEGVQDTPEALKKISEYLNSEFLELIPSIRIGTALYAAIADQATKGRQRPPTKGVFVDIKMIESFLPYCDAMFVDDENTALLQDGRVKAKVGYPTKMFSLRNKEEFLKHLDDILHSADPSHIDLIKQVYGDDWMQPFVTILEHKE